MPSITLSISELPALNPITKRLTALPAWTEPITTNYTLADSRRFPDRLALWEDPGLDIRNQFFAMMAPSLRPVSSSSAVGGVVGALRPGPI